MEGFDVARGRSNTRTCPHKVTFATWAMADRAAYRLRRSSGDKVHPYRCRACARYHVGNTPELGE